MTQMGRLVWALLLLAVHGNPCTATERLDAPTAATEPYMIVQRLRVAQDAIVQLGAPALAAYQRALEDAGAGLRGSPGSSWEAERNASAAVIYLLGGGDRSVAQAILDQPQLNGTVRPLLKASLAFVKGRSKEARELLAPLDLENAPPTLRGNLALVRGIIFSRVEPARARREFALARLHAPGGVVEQVSLRLEIDLARHDGVTANVELLLRQLLLRFPRGLHLEEAIETVAELASRAAASRQSEVSAVLEATLPHLTKDLQLAVSIGFARQAARHGQVALADNWAPRARMLANDGSVPHLQAELYQAAVDVIANDEGAATRHLAAIDQQQLSNDDAMLLQAAIVVDRRIREPVNAPPPLDGPARREPYESGVALEPEAASLLARATANLNLIDRLLEANP